jgi:hypothetical protein
MDKFTYEVWRNGVLEREIVVEASDLDEADEKALKEKDSESSLYLAGFTKE